MHYLTSIIYKADFIEGRNVKRIKFWNIILRYFQRCCIFIPFVTWHMSQWFRFCPVRTKQALIHLLYGSRHLNLRRFNIVWYRKHIYDVLNKGTWWGTWRDEVRDLGGHVVEPPRAIQLWPSWKLMSVKLLLAHVWKYNSSTARILNVSYAHVVFLFGSHEMIFIRRNNFL
jgi:hypothetical protein